MGAVIAEKKKKEKENPVTDECIALPQGRGVLPVKLEINFKLLVSEVLSRRTHTPSDSSA